MTAKIFSKDRIRKAVFGCVFGVMSAVMLVVGVGVPAYAVEGNDNDTAEVVEQAKEDETTAEPVEVTESTETTTNTDNGESCKDSLGAIGWLVCPSTGAIAKAVDWLYDKLENILVINPVEMKDGSPIYEIWKYVKGFTNIVFIIFLMIMVYSQITGVGISNYGIKKALPKLIIAAVLVNLSFLICSLAVDVSNVIGNSLRGVFESVEQATAIYPAGAGMSLSGMYSAMAGGGALALAGGVVAFETGAIWMLIPTVLGAIVAVVSGLITVALRQAVVALLIMIAPMALVAYILPNTEQWFKKWKQLLTRMLVFYPMFSVLFGASQMAGYAIMASSKDGFGLILGVAVQIFPLFFSWKLMQMSGTFLGTINTKLRGLTQPALMANRRWTDSHRMNTRMRYLASGNAYTPTLRLRQYLSDRQIARDFKTKEYGSTVMNRGLSYDARSHYEKGDIENGVASSLGMRMYEMQARNMRYQKIMDRNKNNFNKGLGSLEVTKALPDGDMRKLRLQSLDVQNMNASDGMRMEIERGAYIDYENAKGFYNRVADAKNAHMDSEAIRTGNTRHQFHPGVINYGNLQRYETMKEVMEGKELETNFILAGAAHSFSSQAQVIKGKFSDMFNYTAPTQDVVNILSEFTKSPDSNKYIDPIIAGLRTLNMRGDTDLVREQLKELVSDRKVELGTYVSQSLANFCMFDVKGNNPLIRRFGKYINFETAKMYNEDDPGERRTRKDVSLDEYINGEYIDYDENGEMIRDENGQPKTRKAKRGAAVLLKGTSFKDMERTAIKDMNDAIRESSVDIDENGNRTFNYEKFKKNQTEIWNAIMPNIISDQYSYLSGSEQIVALGKGVTGMDVQKHCFDWKGIFGEEIAKSLTPEQKKDFVKLMNERTKSFLGGQVPVQIAKTKTDMLEAIRNQYAFKDAMENDPEFLERGGDSKFEMSSEEYKAFEQEHMDQIKKEFVGSYKEDALKGFVKMHHKGYQGEAKDGLIQLLNPDELYRQYFGNTEEQHSGKRKQRQRRMDIEDEEDGRPVDADGESYDSESASYAEIRNNIESIYESYSGMASTRVEDFWGKVKPILLEMSVPGVATFVEEIDNSLSQYTTVADLYTHIVNGLFGGFGD